MLFSGIEFLILASCFPQTIFVLYVAALKHYYLLKAWFAVFCAIVKQFFWLCKEKHIIASSMGNIKKFLLRQRGGMEGEREEIRL